MAARKEPSGALPLTVENEETPSATITYANDVVAIIAGLAANEVEGIAGMCNVSGNLLSKNRNVTRGVKVEIGTEEVAVDLYVIIDYGTPIQRAAMDAQESVRKAIESMTGLHVVRVDVHVQSVSFEKENNALQAGASVALESGESVREPEKAADEGKTVEKAKAKQDEVKEEVQPDPVAEEKPADGEDVNEEQSAGNVKKKNKNRKDAEETKPEAEEIPENTAD